MDKNENLEKALKRFKRMIEKKQLFANGKEENTMKNHPQYVVKRKSTLKENRTKK